MRVALAHALALSLVPALSVGAQPNPGGFLDPGPPRGPGGGAVHHPMAPAPGPPPDRWELPEPGRDVLDPVRASLEAGRRAAALQGPEMAAAFERLVDAGVFEDVLLEFESSLRAMDDAPWAGQPIEEPYEGDYEPGNDPYDPEGGYGLGADEGPEPEVLEALRGYYREKGFTAEDECADRPCGRMWFYTGSWGQTGDPWVHVEVQLEEGDTEPWFDCVKVHAETREVRAEACG